MTNFLSKFVYISIIPIENKCRLVIQNIIVLLVVMDKVYFDVT